MASRLKMLLRAARQQNGADCADIPAPALFADGPACRNRRPWSAISHMAKAVGIIATLAAGITAHAGDILRGGAPAGTRGGPAVPGALPPQAQQSASNAKDALARTTQAVQAVKAMQKAA